MLQLTLSKTDTFGTAPADCSSKRGDRFIENRGNNNNSKLTLKLQLFAINNCTYLFNKTVKTVIFSRKVGGAPLRVTIFILLPGLMVYFNTNKTWTFFSCRIPVVLKIRRSSLVVLVRWGGGGGCPPCTLPQYTNRPWHTLRTGETVQNIKVQFAIYCHVQHLHFCFEVFSYCKKHFSSVRCSFSERCPS